MTQLWPAASTATRQRISRTARVSSMAWTPTARPSSNKTSSTLVASWTSTPCSRALSRTNRVEFLPEHLPGPRAFVWLVVGEIKRLGKQPLLGHELHAVLGNESAAPRLVEHAEPFEHPERFRDERFADVVPRKTLPLEQLHRVPLLGDEHRGRHARGAAPDHHHVNVRLSLAGTGLPDHFPTPRFGCLLPGHAAAVAGSSCGARARSRMSISVRSVLRSR